MRTSLEDHEGRPTWVPVRPEVGRVHARLAVASRLMNRLRVPGHEALSPREIEILEQVARGRTNKEIGAALFISEATVKTHPLHIFAKLDVQGRTHAVTAALDRGILRLDA